MPAGCSPGMASSGAPPAMRRRPGRSTHTAACRYPNHGKCGRAKVFRRRRPMGAGNPTARSCTGHASPIGRSITCVSSESSCVPWSLPPWPAVSSTAATATGIITIGADDGRVKLPAKRCPRARQRGSVSPETPGAVFAAGRRAIAFLHCRTLSHGQDCRPHSRTGLANTARHGLHVPRRQLSGAV